MIAPCRKARGIGVIYLPQPPRRPFDHRLGDDGHSITPCNIHRHCVVRMSGRQGKCDAATWWNLTLPPEPRPSSTRLGTRAKGLDAQVSSHESGTLLHHNLQYDEFLTGEAIIFFCWGGKEGVTYSGSHSPRPDRFPENAALHHRITLIMSNQHY